MATNQHVNKVIYGNQTLIDLTNDDVLQSDVLSGKYFHLPSGERVAGTCPYDADTSSDNATAAEVLSGKTAHVQGALVTGSMPNIGAQSIAISDKDTPVSISAGYHDGSGSATIAATEKAKLIAENIREGITLLGVEGTMSGSEDVKATSCSVTPYTTAQTIVPSDLGDFNSITQVNVAAIAYTEVDNSQGGKTVTIGTVAPAPAAS